MLRMNPRALYKLRKCFFPTKLKSQLFSLWGMGSAFVTHWFELLIFLPLLPEYWGDGYEAPHLAATCSFDVENAFVSSREFTHVQVLNINLSVSAL